jgi:hypothetical protein
MIAPPPETAMIVEPRRLSICLPRPLWIGLATIVLVVGAVVLQIAVPIYRRQQQLTAIQEIERVGGKYAADDATPKWLTRLVGDDRMPRFELVWSIDLSDTEISDSALSKLSGVASLTSLDLSGTSVGDAGLIQLRGLQNLETLWLNGTDVTDAGLVQLKELENLKLLWLSGTEVTDAGVADLQRARPGLRVILFR